jgi:hypothetical protein
MASTQAHRATLAKTADDSEQKRPIDDLVKYCKEYAQERPEVCALWCFGIGFVLGWKLKPW